MADWIANAQIKKGALHRALGVPESQPIPESQLEEAKHSKDPQVRRRAHLAVTLQGLNPGSSRQRGPS